MSLDLHRGLTSVGPAFKFGNQFIVGLQNGSYANAFDQRQAGELLLVTKQL